MSVLKCFVNARHAAYFFLFTTRISKFLTQPWQKKIIAIKTLVCFSVALLCMEGIYEIVINIQQFLIFAYIFFVLLHLNHHSTSLPKFFVPQYDTCPLKMAAIATYACNYVIKRPHPQLLIRSKIVLASQPLRLEEEGSGDTVTHYVALQNALSVFSASASQKGKTSAIHCLLCGKTAQPGKRFYLRENNEPSVCVQSLLDNGVC